MKSFKKLKSKLVVAAAASLIAFSANGQAVEQGDVAIGAFYGSPSIGTLFLQALLTADDSDFQTAAEFSFLGPVGIKAEYMVAEKLGIGIEASYSTWSLTSATEKFTATRIRLAPRFSYHLGSSDVFDSYFSLGMGFKNSTYKFTSDDPTAVFDESDLPSTPLTLRIAWGGRYYITEQFAIATELGFGGGYLISGGLVFKP